MTGQTASSLDSQKRAGSFASARAASIRRDYAKSHWRFLVLTSVGMVAPGVAVLPFEHDALVRGLVIGLVLGITSAAVPGLVIVLSGSSAITMGAWAEEWTSEALRPMRDHGYRLINSARVSSADIDHVLVGPGGLVVFETKWSAYDWSLERDPKVQGALRQVNAEADRLRRWLRPPIPIERVVVLWGAAARAVRDKPGKQQRSADGTLVLAGEVLSRWVLGLPRNRLTAQQVNTYYSQLAEQTDRRDAHDAKPARSLSQFFVACLIGFVLGVYGPICGELVAGTLGAIATAGLIGVAALSGHRWVPSRTPRRIALTGSLLWLVLYVLDLLLR